MGKPKKAPKWEGCTLEIHGNDVDVDGPVDTVMLTDFPGHNDGLGNGVFLVVIESESQAERFEKAANHPRLKNVVFETEIDRDARDFLSCMKVGEFEELVVRVTSSPEPMAAADAKGIPETRKYRPDEEPRVGDVLKAFRGSFSSTIIVRAHEKDGDQPTFDLERLNASLHLGTMSISVERIGHVSLESIVSNYEVFVTGASDKVENRDYR
jgi:hypothetical protein